TVTWTSSSITVTVDENGLVVVASDAAPGQYIITATSTEDASKQGIATINVIKITGVRITPGQASVQRGKTQQLTAVVDVLGGAAPGVTWSSSNSNAVSVDGNGLVTVRSDAPLG